MKKLMIAAAAAAMIGGAYANLAYDYTANLKTTVGKGGSQTTAKCELGMNSIDQFWYEDDSIIADLTAIEDSLYRIKSAKTGNTTWYYREYVGVNTNMEGTIVSSDLKDKSSSAIYADCNGYTALVTFSKDSKGAWIGKFNNNFNALDNVDKTAIANYFDGLNDPYNRKSAGKWCQTFTYKAGNVCYRAAGSKKLTALVFGDTCCNDELIGEYTDKNFDGAACAIIFTLNNRFGATTLAKATKVEVCGRVGDDYCDGDSIDQFTVAGQGTWSDKLVKIDGEYVAGVKSISGNIVGVMAAPTCESCCRNPVDATAWTCDEVEDSSIQTAAYGTWTLKFNKKESDL